MIKYSSDHEWIRIDGNKAVIGVSEYAVNQLGDVVFVEVPEVGAEFKKGEVFGNIESVKATSEMFCPVSGKVLAVNEDLEDSPELVNQDPQGKAWIVEIEMTNTSELEGLLDEAAYKAHCDEAGS